MITIKYLLNKYLSNKYLTAMGTKASKTVALLPKFQHILLRHALITIYRAFICPYMDYGDIFYNKGFNSSFH